MPSSTCTLELAKVLTMKALIEKEGYDATAKSVQKMIKIISTYIKQLQKGQSPACFFFHPKKEYPETVAHWLVPFWESLCEALSLFSSQKHTEVEIWRFIKMPLPPTRILSEILFNRNILQLELNGICGINATDLYRFVCEFLENNSQVRCIILKDTSIFYDNDDVDGISRFCYGIEKNKSLEELTMAEELVYTKVDDGYDYDESYLQQILDCCGHLRYLSFRGGDNSESKLGKDWCDRVSSFLGRNPELTNLVLDGSFLEDNEAELLASALKHNTNLRSLDLGVCLGYGITAEGLKKLRKALCNIDSFSAEGVRLSGLNAIASSCNHTCSIQLINENRGISNYEEVCPNEDLLKLFNRYECPKDNRRLKILSALYASGCKGPLEEMEDVPLTFIPDVLAMVSQEVSQDEDGNKLHEEDDDSSAMSMMSIVSYDSELDELDEAFDEWVDDVFVDFHKSFTDPRFTGRRAKLTMFYQILRAYGVCLMEYSSSIPHSNAIPGQKKKEARHRRKRARS